jgi:hypothetical protein
MIVLNERRADVHYTIISGVVYVALERNPSAGPARRKRDVGAPGTYARIG